MKILSGTAIAPTIALLVTCGNALAADSPGKLRSEMAKAEREYIALYNKLNTVPEFAIACRMDTPTGTKFAVRVCQPKYVVDANARSASEIMKFAKDSLDTTAAGSAGGSNAGAGQNGDGGGFATGGKDEAYRQNVLDLMRRNPELQALGKKRDTLQASYDEATRSKSGR